MAPRGTACAQKPNRASRIHTLRCDGSHLDKTIPNLPSYRCEDPLRRAYGTGVETLMGPGLPRGAEGCNRSRMRAWRAPKHAYMAPSHDIARSTREHIDLETRSETRTRPHATYGGTATPRPAKLQAGTSDQPSARPRRLGRPCARALHKPRSVKSMHNTGSADLVQRAAAEPPACAAAARPPPPFAAAA